MKKKICLVFALLLCLTMTALAESTPSRMTSDMTVIEVEAENLPEDSGFFIEPIVENTEQYEERINICEAEVEKLSTSLDLEEYFGEVTDSEGNAVSLKEVLDTDTLNVYEFCPLIAGRYEESYGKVLAKMLFATPYEKDEKVVVMIGLVTVDEMGNQIVKWTAYEGIGIGTQEDINEGVIEEMGAVQVELDPAIVKAIEDGVALLAVVSK